MTHMLFVLARIFRPLTSMRPAPLASSDTSPTNTRYSFANPQLTKRRPRAIQIPWVCSNHRPLSPALSLQLFLLRSPSSLQLQGCPIPLPRCSPPRAPVPYYDARALWYPTLLHSSPSALLDFPAKLHAPPSPHTQVFVSPVHQVWFNCKRVEQITTRPRRHSLSSTVANIFKLHNFATWAGY